jgi:hypothetical protein
VPYFAPDEMDGWNTAYPNRWTNDYRPDGTSSGDWKTRQQRTTKYGGAPTTTAVIGNGYRRGPNYECQLQPLRRLTTSAKIVKDDIDDMTATGDTNIPMGLVWGWHTLAPNAPFSDGSSYSTAGVKKIVVLMTDGQNASYNNGTPSESIYSGSGYFWQNHFGITSGTDLQRRAAMDTRLALLCRNMKAKGIIIYTVRVEVDDTAVDVLRNCATEPSMFFDVKSAGQLNSTFQAIADSILRLRISE